MHFLPYDIEHHAGYPWQFVQGRICFLRLRCNEPVKEITIRFGDPFWFSGQGEKLPVLEEQPVLCEQRFLEDTFYSIAVTEEPVLQSQECMPNEVTGAERLWVDSPQ